MTIVANGVLRIATNRILPRAAATPRQLMTKKTIHQRIIPPRIIPKVKLAASKKVADRAIKREEMVRTLTMVELPVVDRELTTITEDTRELTHSTIEAIMVAMTVDTMVAEIIRVIEAIRVTEAGAITIKGTTEMHLNRAIIVIVMKATEACEALATMGLLAIATIVLLEGGMATPMLRAMAVNSSEAVMTTSPLITMRQVATAATTVAEAKTTAEAMVVSTSPATTTQTQIKETGKIEHLPHSDQTR